MRAVLPRRALGVVRSLMNTLLPPPKKKVMFYIGLSIPAPIARSHYCQQLTLCLCVTHLQIASSFYRAMHFSANARSWDRMSSVRLSVCNVGGL